MEQKTVQFDELPGVFTRLTRGGDDQFGPNWITYECFDSNMNPIPGTRGGFRGPGVPVPESESEETEDQPAQP
ncbi:hypothetical protein SEA_BENCZKOWSKI14_30 [Gordonia phage Benczkowski14]|uniref:Uncharacterized protein n=5 Tax=Demosthenesvirus katyusha TaxID=1982108 RepID=A0A345MCG1_9CAUD|nr:hypothetical protein BH765_gp30 [Gordonia phage Kvothe]YP_009603304.1 hypothetical protein FDH67_gp30 [Gordonia phage Katyusha]AMS03740.1 hypothetical protein SEA_BENCZKOWSKI14_30 [Gordonia phage Benczkowski14]AXH68182.1 hypothetical protein SEA_TEATEALATTE_30 [Gordonia phage Teatealatte]QBP29588.1 hypothetical protein SEA_TREDGE_30 [Gordonia phage Tredge]UJD20668.1 hypothetical protein SEA_NIAGARA_30 [Gordonia phage Niagara]AMS03423.1 hypothetical protein SEA_KATYUSHA_30 [Gordonia phage K